MTFLKSFNNHIALHTLSQSYATSPSCSLQNPDYSLYTQAHQYRHHLLIHVRKGNLAHADIKDDAILPPFSLVFFQVESAPLPWL